MKRIVTIGGGTGQYVLLSGLKTVDVAITAIVTTADSGGSSGQLRIERGVLPPSDILRCLLALAPGSDLKEILWYRFDGQGGLVPHTVGNILLTALQEKEMDINKAIKKLAGMLSIPSNYEVIPVTKDQVTIRARLVDGQEIVGEGNIDIPKHDANTPIEKVWLDPCGRMTPHTFKALVEADLIVLCMGDLYTSLLPNLLVEDVHKVICESRAQVAYIVNLMTKYGETDGFTASRFILEVEKYLERKIGYGIINTALPSQELLQKYKEELAFPVEVDLKEGDWEGRRVILDNLLSTKGDIARHNPQKTVELILSLVKERDWPPVHS